MILKNKIYFGTWLMIKKYLPEVLFSFLFLYVYLPYFIYTPVPFIRWDSYAYMLIAKDLFEGNIPLKDYIFDLPYGFSFFINIVYRLGLSLDYVVLFQTIFCFFSALFLVRQVKKMSFKLGVAFSVLLFLYLSLSDSMLWNMLIYSESLYISSLFMVVGLTIRQFRIKSKLNIYLLLLGVLVSLYIRSNALFLFFIPLVLFISYVKEKNILWRHVVIATLLLLLVNSTTNYFVKGFFAPGDSKRIAFAMNEFYQRKKAETSSVQDSLNPAIVEHRLLGKQFNYRTQAWALFTNMANNDMGNHYYYRVPKAFSTFCADSLKNEIKSRKILQKYKINYDSAEVMVSFIHKNYNLDKPAFNNLADISNIELRPRHPWLYSVHLLHLCRICIRNYIFVLLFYLVFIISVVKLFRPNSMNRDSWKLIFLLSSLHILSLLILTLPDPVDYAYRISLSRYAIVTEFIAYLVICMGIYIITSKSDLFQSQSVKE